MGIRCDLIYVFDVLDAAQYTKIGGNDYLDNLLKQREATITNLKDAGCTQDFIDRFMRLAEQSKMKELFSMLAEQRESLLEITHKNNHMIDCLDYLTYRMKKGNK